MVELLSNPTFVISLIFMTIVGIIAVTWVIRILNKMKTIDKHLSKKEDEELDMYGNPYKKF